MSSRPTARELGRQAIRPKWIAVWVVTAVAIAACIVLGRWQWDRTQDILDAERAAAAAPIDIEALGGQLLPENIGRPVTATGRYLDSQVLVRSRELDGTPGIWVVTPLRLPDGSLSAVVRGWLPSETSPGLAPTAGEIQVEGILHPDESFYASTVIEDGRAMAISSNQLGAFWGEPTRPGFIMLQRQLPLGDPAPLPVPPTVQTADVPFPLRNFFYAFQWWIFAAFAVALAARFLWLEAAQEAAQDAAEAEAS